MNPAIYFANTQHSLTPSVNFQNSTTPLLSNENDQLATHTIHSTYHESSLAIDKIGLKEAPIHWLDTLEQKYHTDDQSIYPSAIDLFKLKIRKKDFKQFILYLISHKYELIKATSPVFINRGTKDLPYSLLYVPNGSHQGAYINLKEHLLPKVGSGAFNKATLCSSIHDQPGKLAIFRCGRFHSVPSSEVKIMSILTEFEDYFVTGPCFNYKGSCAPRSASDANVAGLEYEESEEERTFSNTATNSEHKPKPRLRCHSIGPEILLKSISTLASSSTSEEDEGNSKQIVNKIGFVLDLLHDLNDYIEDPEEINSTLEIMVKIATCLHILHNGCNLVHLDLKPSNIFLTDELKPKLADFGLSAKKDEEIGTGGTFYYCAPELVEISEKDIFKAADYSADIWSFGVNLICMLGGKTVWQKLLDRHDDITDITERYQKITRDFYYLAKKQYKNDPISLKIVEVIKKCIVVEPESRISTYDALIELNQILKPKRDPLEKISPLILVEKLQKKLEHHDSKFDYLKEIKPAGYSDRELHKVLSLCVQEKSQWINAKSPLFIPFQGNFFNGIIYIPSKPALYLSKAKSPESYEVNLDTHQPFINEFFNPDKHFPTTLSRKLQEKEIIANKTLIDHPHMFVVGPELNFEENKNKKTGFLIDISKYKLPKTLNVPGKLSTEKIVEIITKLISAIKVLEDSNLVHCNLNPNCIWLSKDLEPRIADFRLCEEKGKKISNYKAHNQFKAPEMSHPKFEMTSAVDVWGLGMIILNIYGWERNPQFFEDGKFSYSQFLSNRKVVFEELKTQFAKSWYLSQMIELMEGCLEEEPKQRPTVQQLIKKLHSISTFLKLDKN